MLIFLNIGEMAKSEAIVLCSFYSLYCDLCTDANLTPSGAATAIGFNRATVTTWKNTGNAPKGDLLLKISDYFGVPVDFLLQKPPFDCWDLINQNRKGFLYYVDIDPDVLKIIWGIDSKDPDTTPMKDFISFLSMAIQDVRPTEEGDWVVKLRPPYQKEKAPTQEGERIADLSPAFFRLKQGLEPYDLSEADADFLLEVYRAHIKKNQ